MKFSLSSDQLHFFQENGSIEFEQFLSHTQLKAINEAIDQALPTSSKKTSAEELFLEGRDLWLRHPSLSKWACHSQFAGLLSELIVKRPIRLGFDQFFPFPETTQINHPKSSQEIYTSFLNQSSTLEEISCINGVTGGLIVALSSASGVREKNDPFPFHAGSALFINPSLIWEWKSIYKHFGQRFYMLVYTDQLAWYHLRPGDPHTHAWKKRGYVFNEKLTDQQHPIVYR